MSLTDDIVIQLAKFNDMGNSQSNAIWNNHNKQSVTINQGDQVMISKSYIDTRSLSSNAIVILEDTPLELEFYFYWVNNGNPGNTTAGLESTYGGAGENPNCWLNDKDAIFPQYSVNLTLQSVPNIQLPTFISNQPEIGTLSGYLTTTTLNCSQQKVYADGRPYLLCYTNNKPFTQTWKYTLPAGTYSPDALSSLLTTNMAEVKKETAEALSKPNAVDWFDPYAPVVNLPLDKTLDQPFIVDTNGIPNYTLPFSSTSTSYPAPLNASQGVLNSQPYIQILQNNGLPDWEIGTTGTILTNTTGTLLPPVKYLPGPPPVPSLCFKNIISDCPIPNSTVNLPIIPPSNIVIPASDMAVGLYYEIVSIGDTTNWLLAGDTNIPPAVGNRFVCVKNPGVLPNPTIGFLQMALYKQYQVVSPGLPWTGTGGYDTNWALYGNAGSGVFNTNTTNPTSITLTNSTNIGLINLDITYTITSSTNVDWSLFGESIPFDDPISYNNMTNLTAYKITDLGKPFINGTYDTHWQALSNSVLSNSPDVGDDFVNVGNPPSSTNWVISNETNFSSMVLDITYNVTATQNIDWSLFGVSNYLSPEISFTQIVQGDDYIITDPGVVWGGGLYNDTNWTPTTGNDLQTIGKTFIANANGNSAGSIWIINTLGFFQSITPGISLTVENAGNVDWRDYGYTGGGQSGSFSYQNMDLGGIYTIVNLGIPYNGGYDTNWQAMGGSANPQVGETFNCVGISNLSFTQDDLFNFELGMNLTVTNLGNIDWTTWGWNPENNVAYPDMIAGSAYTIISTGILMGDGIPDSPWIDTGFLTNGLYSTTTDCQTPVAEVEILDYTSMTTYISVGLSIFVQEGGNVDWQSFGYGGTDTSNFGFIVLFIPPVIPNDITCQAYILQTGLVLPTSQFTSTITFTITNIPLVTGSEVCSGFINGTGTVSQLQFVTPFTFLVTEIPSYAPPVNIGTSLVVATGKVKPINVLTPFTFTCSSIPNPLPANIGQSYTATVLGTGMVQSFNPTFPFTFKCTSIPTILPIDVTYSGSLLPTGTVNFSLGEGTVFEYGIDPTNPNFYIYPLKVETDTNINMSGSASNEGDTFALTFSRVINYNFPLVGSTEIELAFNDAANIFQWNYTHSPILQAGPPSGSDVNVTFSEVVGIVNSFIPTPLPATQPFTGTGYTSSTCKLVTQSGLLFKRMSPESFWFDTLGFSNTLLVSMEELGLSDEGKLNPIYLPADVNRFTYERFNNVTTRGLLSTSMNFTQSPNFPNSQPSYVSGMYYPLLTTSPVQSLNSSVIDEWYAYELSYNFALNVAGYLTKFIGASGALSNGNQSAGTTFPTPPPWNEQWFQALDQTVTIPAIQPPLLIADNYGHYLLEVQGYEGGGMLNEEQKYNVKSIISSYYVNPGSFTTGPFLDPQVYTHVGEPLTLNNFRVRILDPETMEAVNGLNGNSSVYLQINKAYSQIESTQVVSS